MKLELDDSEIKLIKKYSKEFNLNPILITAMCLHESYGESYIVRFEPMWRYHTEVAVFARANKISKETESVLQAMSFGLMQIMGGTAREMGYNGLLTMLVKPELSLYYGCKYFARKKQIYKNSVPDALAAYNAGIAKQDKTGKFVNQKYVDHVMGHYERLLGGLNENQINKLYHSPDSGLKETSKK